MNPYPQLGLGIGWRPELAVLIERRADLGFVEILAEDHWDDGVLPAAIDVLRERGVPVVPHGVSLSLGGTEPPARHRLEALARLARRVDAPFVSEHLAFVRAGGLETGHLLPLPRTREALEIAVRNVRAAQAMLPVPLVLENIAALFEWPGAEMDEEDFIGEVLERTNALLLLDLANLYANGRNLGFDATTRLGRLPLERVAYVHLAGGSAHADGLYHDTHAHPLPLPVLGLLRALCERKAPPGVLIERDDRFPPDAVFNAELDAVAAVMARGSVAGAMQHSAGRDAAQIDGCHPEDTPRSFAVAAR